MIPGPALGTGEPPRDAVDQGRVVDLQLDHRVDPLMRPAQHVVQCFGLSHVAREAIQDEPRLCVRLPDARLQHVDQQAIRDQLTRFHQHLGLLTRLAAGRDFGPQHVTGGDLRHAMSLFEPFGLRALTGARRSQQNDIHRPRPFTRAFLMRPSY